MAEDVEFDPMLIEFGALMERYKFLYLKAVAEGKLPKEFDNLGIELLKGKYAKEKDREYLVHSGDRKVTVSNSSSGQQAVLPIVLVASVISDQGTESGDGVTLYIEEPEAHIFPDSQKRVVQLLARTYNQRMDGCQLFITTHSPYILTAFNNLIEAGNVIEKHPDRAERVYEIVPKEEVLFMRDFAPYMIKDGKAVLMVEEETGLIAANMIDDVSDQIGSEFEALLDLAYE